MSQPNFYEEGNDQRRLDTRARVTKKWLGIIRDNGEGTSAENPQRLDTLQQTRQKILRAKQP